MAEAEELDLPEWADSIGEIAYGQMVAMYGGTQYFVPAKLDSHRGNVLADLIGEYAAKNLIEAWGDTRVYVARNAALERDANVEVISALRRGGMSAKRISEVFEYRGRYTERQVRRILSAEGLTETQEGA